jgi:hypothetical protein
MEKSVLKVRLTLEACDEGEAGEVRCWGGLMRDRLMLERPVLKERPVLGRPLMKGRLILEKQVMNL